MPVDTIAWRSVLERLVSPDKVFVLLCFVQPGEWFSQRPFPAQWKSFVNLNPRRKVGKSLILCLCHWKTKENNFSEGFPKSAFPRHVTVSAPNVTSGTERNLFMGANPMTVICHTPKNYPQSLALLSVPEVTFGAETVYSVQCALHITFQAGNSTENLWKLHQAVFSFFWHIDWNWTMPNIFNFWHPWFPSIHTHIHKHTPHIHTHRHTHTYTSKHTSTHTYTHTHKHTNTHGHTHIHK